MYSSEAAKKNKNKTTDKQTRTNARSLEKRKQFRSAGAVYRMSSKNARHIMHQFHIDSHEMSVIVIINMPLFRNPCTQQIIGLEFNVKKPTVIQSRLRWACANMSGKKEQRAKFVFNAKARAKAKAKKRNVTESVCKLKRHKRNNGFSYNVHTAQPSKSEIECRSSSVGC